MQIGSKAREIVNQAQAPVYEIKLIIVVVHIFIHLKENRIGFNQGQIVLNFEDLTD